MTIRQLRKSWWVDFRFNGKRYRRRSPENTPTGAKAYEKVLQQKLARGVPIDPVPEIKSETFAEFAEEWFNTYVMSNNKPTEQRGKQGILKNNLLPVFGELPLNKIGAEDIERYKASMRDRVSSKTINNHLTVLRKCLQTACDWGKLKDVPKITWLRCNPPERDFLTIEESVQLVKAAVGEPHWYAFILLALRTGMRLGEMFGLEWQNVDFQQSVITIRRSIVEGNVSSPKTHRERKVAFPKSVGDALKVIGPCSEGLIFHRDDGRPLSHGIAEHALNRMLERAGLRHIGWHALRHSCASQMAQLSGSSLEAQRMLGHTTSAMTEKYTHIVPSALHNVVAELDKAANFIKFGQPVGNSVEL